MEAIKRKIRNVLKENITSTCVKCEKDIRCIKERCMYNDECSSYWSPSDELLDKLTNEIAGVILSAEIGGHLWEP